MLTYFTYLSYEMEKVQFESRMDLEKLQRGALGLSVSRYHRKCNPLQSQILGI